jgi:hypothetical protein
MSSPTERQRALYQQYVAHRADPEATLQVEQHLRQIASLEPFGIGDRLLAQGLHLPVAYVRALRATVREPGRPTTPGAQSA